MAFGLTNAPVTFQRLMEATCLIYLDDIIIQDRKGYMCNFWNFGQWPSFIPKYGNFENLPVSQKPLPVE